MIKYTQLLVVSVVLLFAPEICEAKREHLIQGHTMGTTYHITVVTGNNQGIAGLKEKIDKRLVEINDNMSTYKKDSEISRFNDWQQAGKAFEISDDFYRVMVAAKSVFELTDGAWDGTVNPLVDLWGFGRAGRRSVLPRQQQIAALLPAIGFENIQILPNRTLVKKIRSVTLDLSSIAKGYGVDQVAQFIRLVGLNDFLVEIGGEIFASGRRTDGKLWRVGINRPRKDAAFNDVYKIVDLDNQAFATSGDYRNFFEANGIRYSHIIDPKTGYPVSNGVVSASIIAVNCTLADGLATALMIMGPGKGINLIEHLENVEGLIVVETPDGSLVDYSSRGFLTAGQPVN